MQTTPLDGAFGAQVLDVNLADAVDEAFAKELRELLLRERLLVFRGQQLDARSLRDLGRCLGTLDVHPFIESVEGVPEVVAIVKEADEKRNFGGAWHSEVSFYERPAMGTMLYAVETPDEGGDTLLADGVRAYEALPAETQARIEGMQGIHTAEHVYGAGGFYQDRATGGASGTKTRDMQAAQGRVAHPIVRTHPETGEKILYVNLAFTVGIEGMADAEARPFLNELIQHATSPPFVTRLHWEPGTLAMWDNRSTQHNALNDYPGQRREMLRVVIEGDRPF
ncbi:MAG: TauD/TfdA family dioxygenase [Myxococcota bacterium]|nr:TauD/TfdA family dioxygenase [Myxococcota bacterium]